MNNQSSQSSYLNFPRESVRKILNQKLKELQTLEKTTIFTESDLEKSVAELRRLKDYTAEYLDRAFNEDSYKKEFTRALGARIIAENLEEKKENLNTELKEKIVRLESILGRLDLIPEIIPIENLTSSLPNIQAANLSLATISNVRENLSNISNIYSNMGAAVINNFQAIDLKPLLSSIQNVQQIAGTNMWREIVDSVANSPTISAVQSIQNLNIPTLDYYVPQKIVSAKVVKEIDTAKYKKADRIFNYPAYKYIFNLEVFLRTFINKYIIKPNIKQLASKIPPEILDDWEKKKKDEEQNLLIDHEHVSYDLIEYSDFTHIKTILDKTSSIRILKDVISEAHLKTITSKLFELEPIRIKIAHSRALTEDEFNTLKVYSDKIRTVITKASKK